MVVYLRFNCFFYDETLKHRKVILSAENLANRDGCRYNRIVTTKPFMLNRATSRKLRTATTFLLLTTTLPAAEPKEILLWPNHHDGAAAVCGHRR